jgi:hypothetical protein
MKNNMKIKTAVTVFIAVFVLMVGIAIFKGKSSSAQDTADLTVAETSDSVGREVLALLDDLRKIKLDDSIFKNPMFQELEDYSVTIPAELKGRKNPFNPIGVDDIIMPATVGSSTGADAGNT